jgi:tetratricopeptide (TPR) repeat protein
VPSFGEAPSVAAPAAEEDPAVTEAFTEVEVLIKYGLAAKALEQLESLAAKHPSSIAVRAKLRDLYQEQGNIVKAVQHVIALADLYAGRGQGDQAAAVLREALTFAPGDRDLMVRLGQAPAEETAPALSLEAEAVTLETPSFGEVSLEGAATEAPSLEQEMLTSEESPAVESVPSFGEISLEQPASASAGETVEESLAVEWTPPAAEPTAAEISAPSFSAALEESLAAPVDISELWAEGEFFFQQGLYDEAKRQYQKILEHAPGDQRALARIAEIARTSEDERELSKLAEAVEGLERFVPSGAGEAGASVSESDEEAVRSLMREIEMMKRAEAGKEPSRMLDAAAQPPREVRPSPAAEAADEFFDLAAELREDLGSVSLPAKGAASAEEQSLDDIFEEFKQGVEARSSQQDSDTHYNLGIAYKEMGLLDDAIAEFLLTHEGEPMFVQSRYMLGLCFMEKGDFLKAIAEVRNALGYAESFALDAEDLLSMQYDLGLAYQGAGNAGEATRQFQAVHAANPGFRDVAAKLNDLREGDFVSLDQLKEDIEREISAKFLEEGERINREEQTRKSEKVKH